MPIEALDGYKLPTLGHARMYRLGHVLDGQEQHWIDCAYSIERNHGLVRFHQEDWNYFMFAADVGWASLLLIKVNPMQDHLALNFVEIVL